VPEFLAAVVLSEVLAGGEASRLYQRLVKEDRLAADVGAAVGSFGDPYEMRDPTILQILAWHPGSTADQLLTVIDEELDRLDSTLTAAEVERVVTGMVSGHLRHLDNVLQRAMEVGMLEQQRGRGELVNELPGLLGEITPAGVVAVSDRWIRGTGRAVLEVIPGAEAAA
jgi:zinc protease